MGLIDWFRRKPPTSDFQEEVEAHIAMRAEHDGSSESAARRRFGNALQTEEQMRGVWIASYWDTLMQDASYTMRSLRRSPAFTLTAVFVMAAALGSSTALFSVLDRILFRDLPYQESDRLVSLGYIAPLDAHEFMLDGEYVQLWRPPPEPFAAVTVTDPTTQVCDLTEEQPLRLSCTRVQANLLATLGLHVAAGRDFTPEDDLPGVPPVALISYSLSRACSFP